MKKKDRLMAIPTFFSNICLGNPMNIKLPIDCNIVKARLITC